MNKENHNLSGLCHRCEWRAKFIEGLARPRYECGELESNKYACYMYQPTQPVSIARLNNDDIRPISLNIMGCRVRRMETGELVTFKLKSIKDGERLIPYWIPVLSKTDNLK